MAEFTTTMLLEKVQELVNAQFQTAWERQRRSIDPQSTMLERSIARVEQAMVEVHSTTEALQSALQSTYDRLVKKLPEFRQRIDNFKSATGVDLSVLDPSRINWRRLEKRHGLRIEEERALKRAVVWVHELQQPIPSLSEEDRLCRWARTQLVSWNEAKEELRKAESEAEWIDDSVKRICPPALPEVIQTLEDVEDVDNDILDQLVDWLEANQPDCVTVQYEHRLATTWREVKIHLPDGSIMEFELD